MATSAIAPTAALGTSATQGTGNKNTQSSGSGAGLGGLTATDFLNLMVAQLQNQDPLNPTSSDSFLTQTAALSQVQGMQQLNQNIGSLLSLQQVTQGADLIGKKVSYLPSGGGGTQSGVVSGVSLVNGQAQLNVGTASVALSQVQSVQAA